MVARSERLTGSSEDDTSNCFIDDVKILKMIYLKEELPVRIKLSQ